MIINGVHKNGNVRGFTLLELLIAITILATGLLSAAAMQSVAMNANSFASRIYAATMVGQKVVEDLSALKISDPLLHSSVTNASYHRMLDPVTNATTASTVSMPGGGTFSAQYDVAPNTPMTGTTKITVRVFYKGSTTPVATFSTCKLVT